MDSRLKSIAVLLAVLAIALPAPAMTADLGVGYCPVAANARLVTIATDAQLTSEVVKLMDESVAVSEDPRWVNSSRPAFLWANEAKVACGKAYGYLRASYRDDEFLNKCECFHSRMVQYMN